jgi:hypothetical protein
MNAIDAAIITIWLLPLAVVLTGLCLMLSDLASLQFRVPHLPRSRRDHRRAR